MHQDVAEIFKDCGASEDDLAMLEIICLVAVQETRRNIIARAEVVPENMKLPLRVLLARVIHADMEKAFMQYRTTGDQAVGHAALH